MAIYELGSEPGTKVIKSHVREIDPERTFSGCTLPHKAIAIEELWDWQLNYNGPGPYHIFLDLCGYSMHEYGACFFPYEGKNPCEVLGFVELSLLAAALEVVAQYGYYQSYDWINMLDKQDEDEA